MRSSLCEEVFSSASRLLRKVVSPKALGSFKTKSFSSVTNFRRTMTQMLTSLPAPRSQWWVQSPPLNLLFKNSLWSVQCTDVPCLDRSEVTDFQGEPNANVSYSGIMGWKRCALDLWRIFSLSFVSLVCKPYPEAITCRKPFWGWWWGWSLQYC